MGGHRQLGSSQGSEEGARADRESVLREREQCDPAGSRPRPESTACSHPPFRVQRIFSIPTRVKQSARVAAEATVARAARRGRARVWVPGCKTGGVAYAVAMLLAQAAGSSRAIRLSIFGTDRDEEALDMARLGRYPAAAALDMDPEWRARYMFDQADSIRVTEELRRICVFSRHDLLRNLPITRVDLLVCQRVFDGVPPLKRRELVERFHFALRAGGALLAFDHVELYPSALFEQVGPGYLVARQAARARQPSPLLAVMQADDLAARVRSLVDRGLSRGRGALAALSLASPSPVDTGRYVPRLGQPLVLCDSKLSVVYSSREVAETWSLSEASWGEPLEAIAGQLPGGAELVGVAQSVLVGRRTRDIVVRKARRAFLVRIAAADDGGGISILFTDVTAFEATAIRAIREQDKLSALARLGRLVRSQSNLRAVGDEALGAALAVAAGCTSGLVLTRSTGTGELEIAASRGLGDLPQARLDELPGAREILALAMEQAAVRHRAPHDTGASDAAALGRAPLAPAHSFACGVAAPILVAGEVLGAVALFGARARDDESVRDFVAAVAARVGEALVQQRVRRRVALELDVGTLLAGATTLEQVGVGLLGVLSSFGVDNIEIATSTTSGGWRRLYPGDSGDIVLPAMGPGDEPVFAQGSGAGELRVAADGRDGVRHLLRLQGHGVVAPDVEQARALRRLAELLASFVDRWRASVIDPPRDAPQMRRLDDSDEPSLALFDELPVGVSIHDEAGAIRAVNSRFVALGAELREGPSGRHLDGCSMLRRLYEKELTSWLARVLATGEPIFDVELDVEESGQKRYWLCNLAPFHSRSGELCGAIVVVQDVSAPRRAEEALRDADRQKDEFLALLGHELRNPMAAIRNATELLGRCEPPTPQLLRLKSIFERQTAQTTKLVDGLLDVARVARGKVELQRVPLELTELVRQAVDDRNKQFDGRQLCLLLPDSELWIQADRVRLIQILDNLISNALKFTRQRGCITIELRHSAARVCVRIEDDGDGIEPELLPHIFEPFRQGRATKGQGLGLGLALVRGLCDLHGFSLMVQSEGAGRGACFQIEIPLVAAPDSVAPESRVDGRSLQLLLVEDNADVAETLAELLQAEGHRVEVVESAERGLDVLRVRRPDAVISDIGLPGMDGLGLARSVRDEPSLSNLKLVALTGFGDATSQLRMKEAGFDRWLIKPVQLDALRSCLARMAAR